MEGNASGTLAFTRAQKKTFFNKTYGQCGFGALPKAGACRAAPQNLLDFALVGKKVKTEPKDFANFKVGGQVRAAPHCT